MAAIPRFFLSNRTRENLVLNSSRQLSSLFLWRADTQSGFNDPSRRMHCDQKLMMWRSSLDFVCLEAFISINLCKLPRSRLLARVAESLPPWHNFQSARHPLANLGPVAKRGIGSPEPIR